MNRYRILLRRFFAARRLGFTFIGTTKSQLPKRARLCGRAVNLDFPSDTGYMSDIINLWLDDEYGIRQLRTAPETVVDVGGNIGLFSLWAWSHFPNTTLHTYEPNPRVFAQLKSNLEPTHAHVFKNGVGSQPGFARLNDDTDSRNASTTLVDDGEIEIRSLSQVVANIGGKVDLLKMDCEGAEWDIFEDKDAFAKIDAIRMEYHLDGLHSVETLKLLTEGLGYRMVHHSPNRGFGIAWFNKK
jgi:FkbM family methyltransferase